MGRAEMAAKILEFYEKGNTAWQLRTGAADSAEV